MTILPKNEVPQAILNDSVVAHIAAAYFSVGKKLERKTKCSATRGFILATLRDGAKLNQNQIANCLDIDRTVVHRAIKAMKQDGLVTERKAKTGRAINVSITPKGIGYRRHLIEARRAADQAVKARMSSSEQKTLIRLLRLVTECEF